MLFNLQSILANLACGKLQASEKEKQFGVRKVNQGRIWVRSFPACDATHLQLQGGREKKEKKRKKKATINNGADDAFLCEQSVEVRLSAKRTSEPTSKVVDSIFQIPVHTSETMRAVGKIRIALKLGDSFSRALRNAVVRTMERGLCSLCRGLSVESLTQPEGYQHAAIAEKLRECAKTCKMCQIIDASLKEKEPDDGSMSGALISRLYIPGEGGQLKAALEVAGFRQRDLVRVYTHDM
ncbi:hypothetical protein B0O99DRAFT_599519 [Bisporella sp. PMI_857]|nr:hypothetical protein B0O99DRAFT_599519 [Bisporella sp. PMI_857]